MGGRARIVPADQAHPGEAEIVVPAIVVVERDSEQVPAGFEGSIDGDENARHFELFGMIPAEVRLERGARRTEPNVLARHFLAIEEDHHTVVVLEVQFEMIEWLCSSWTQLSGLHRWNSQIPKLLWKRVLLLTLAKSEAVEAGE